MGKREPQQTGETEDTSFEALLRRVAHASGPRPAGASSLRIHPGAQLLEGRLQILRRIGEGGMGVVYEARDAHRAENVALKTLSRLAPEEIYRLKNEFRALVDLSHPHLCRLHELFNDGDDWFFTMELVGGTRFDHYVRPQGTLDLQRLQSSLRQLHGGIRAIHAAGKLHRDLKPSNVLVTGDGRVVVLDFGLAVDRTGGGAGQTVLEGGITGTPAFMAPEQAAGLAATEASDLYAVGVMLFEALTGELPFSGAVGELLAAKQRDAEPSVSNLAPGDPPHLAKLCDGLLARAPKDRPTAQLLGEQLDHGPAPATPGPSQGPLPTTASAPDPTPSGTQLWGREAELQALRDAYARTTDDNAVVKVLSGESGMGKSALVATFLDELRAAGSAMVLAGRCYERENVPFKAFDALIDDLSRYLRKLPREEAIALLPRDVFALAQVFPVLARVPVVAEAPVRRVEDPHELRRRAFRAFGELLIRTRDRRPLCVHVDDLQWVDQDSVLFMRALLVDRRPASVLLLLSHRSEDADKNALLAAILQVAETNSKMSVEPLTIAPLEREAALALALARLPTELPSRDKLAETIVEEAGGSPFFLAELARHAGRTGGAIEGLSLSSVLSAHLGALPTATRALLQVTALAGQPLQADVLLRAAESGHSALDELRARQLVRVSGAGQEQTIECYHDRIRESVAGGLPSHLREHGYRALSEALLAKTDADPELIATCLEGSGQRLRAAEYAARAATRAERGMAFDRAAELYRRALSLGAQDDLERHAHGIALASALANAGRGREAADAYLAVAAASTGLESIQLQRQAADQLLTCGEVAQGRELLGRVCDAVGFRLPATRRAVLLSLAWTQAQLRLRRLEVDCSQPAVLSEQEQIRFDVACSATHSLTALEPLMAAAMADRVLLLALQTRDRAHLARALCYQAFFATALTPQAEARIARLYTLAEGYAAGLGKPELDGLIMLNKGGGRSYGRAMDKEDARALLLRALELLRGCQGVHYEVDAANIFLVLLPTTDLLKEAQLAAQLVEESLSLGRLWCAGMVAGSSTVPRLATGDLSGVERDLQQVQALWKPQDEMAWIDCTLLMGAASVAHYRGEPAAALASLEARWQAFERSMLSKAASSRREMHATRGLLALSVARTSPDEKRRAALLKVVAADRKVVAKVAQEADSHALLALTVGLALERGNRTAALDALKTFASQPSTLDLPKLCARRRLGQLLGPSQGAALAAEAETEMKRRGATDLERTTELVLPGCSLPPEP